MPTNLVKNGKKCNEWKYTHMKHTFKIVLIDKLKDVHFKRHIFFLLNCYIHLWYKFTANEQWKEFLNLLGLSTKSPTIHIKVFSFKAEVRWTFPVPLLISYIVLKILACTLNQNKQTKNTTVVCGLTRRNKAIIIHSSYVNSENIKCKYLINTNVSLANYLVIKSLYIVIQKTIAFLFTCNKLLKIIIFERDNL